MTADEMGKEHCDHHDKRVSPQNNPVRNRRRSPCDIHPTRPRTVSRNAVLLSYPLAKGGLSEVLHARKNLPQPLPAKEGSHDAARCTLNTYLLVKEGSR